MSPTPVPCPAFNYEKYPKADALLSARVSVLLKNIASATFDASASCADTRAVHGSLFADLTPPEQPYYAGHYRGEYFECLEHYPITFSGKLGCDPPLVGNMMLQIRARVRSGLRMIEQGSSSWSEKSLAINLVEFTAEVFWRFLNVHPYANGNGHIARFIVCAFMIPYGYLPGQWTIHPRPIDDHAYVSAIRAYDQGNRIELVKLVAQWFT